jgi:1-pyrroline-5-carboxylate dehydrogenase
LHKPRPCWWVRTWYGPPTHEIVTQKYFGPVFGVHVFDDGDYGRAVHEMDDVAAYAFTGRS